MFDDDDDDDDDSERSKISFTSSENYLTTQNGIHALR